MNEDLEFIQSVIKEEIKTWTGYKRELADDVGEKEFIQEMGLDVEEYIENSGYPLEKEVILEYLNFLVDNGNFPF